MLIFVGLTAASCNVMADKNLREIFGDQVINQLSPDGQNLGHFMAEHCQSLHSEEIVSQKTEQFFKKYNIPLEELILTPNPFIQDKNGRTPREIAQKIFDNTGSFNCYRVAKKFAEMEKEFIKKIEQQ